MLALDGYSIFQLVILCILVVFLVVYIVLYSLWKKGKRFGYLESSFIRSQNLLSLLVPRFKFRFLTNTNKKEQSFYWMVVLLSFMSALLGFINDIVVNKIFTPIQLVFSLLFLGLLVSLLITDDSLAAVPPQVYPYNPSLVVYSIVFMFYELLNFIQALASGSLAGVLFGLFFFMGYLLLYGGIILMRYIRKLFPLGTPLIYCGGVIISITTLVSLVINSIGTHPMTITCFVFSTLSEIATSIAIIYVYDHFELGKSICNKLRSGH